MIAPDPAALASSVPGAPSPLAAGSAGELVLLVAALATLPFLLGVVTSFAKLVVVGGLLRLALGTPRVPPASVITGLALVLTIHIMWPVAAASHAEYRRLRADAGSGSPAYLDAAAGVQPALHGFLSRHAHARSVELFESLRARGGGAPPPREALRDALAGAAPAAPADRLDAAARLADDATVLAPAFLLSELTEAFQIGFLLFVPFLVIDLVVSSVLLSMGMHMLSPTTISLPFKLLLFILMDGWTLLMRGVVMNYL